MFYGEKHVILAMGKLDEISEHWKFVEEVCSTTCGKYLAFTHHSIYVWSHEY